MIIHTKCISPKSVMDVLPVDLISGSPKFLYRLAGIAYGYEQGTGTYGDWFRFLGKFRAVRADGVIYESDACFVQGNVEGRMVTAFKDNIKVQDFCIEFVFDISILKSNKPNIPYEYMVLDVVNNAKSAGVFERLSNAVSDKRLLT